uniref:DUF7153 domain-containing protein n=1 Tax=Romanomermis culicivorax TaxID=13658 RepID=A0A915J3A7_ROMCU
MQQSHGKIFRFPDYSVRHHHAIRSLFLKMPIVDPNAAGPKRYAVFTFVQDEKPGCPTSPAQRFPMSPHASSFEASTRLKQSELFHMKRLKSLEKHVSYPFVDVTFFSSYQNANDMKNLLEPSDCINLHDHTILLQKGCFEEVQLVDPKRDMILTPIDSDDPLTERMTGRGVTTENKIPYDTPEERAEDYKLTRGYIIIAYKTMEHMYRQLGLRRIAFYRQISTTSDFTYVLVIEIINLLVYAAQTLNLMDSIKLRLCGYTGIFRECDFQVDLATAAVHKIETTYRPPPTYKPISSGSMKSNAGQNKGSRRSSSESQYKLLEPVGEDAENEKDENVTNTISASNDVQVLTEMFRKKTEIANRRRKEQEIAAKLDEQRKTKLFKLYSVHWFYLRHPFNRGRNSIPDYAPPPPPSDYGRDDDYGNSDWLNDNDFIKAPKAMPESPDSIADSVENLDVNTENHTPPEQQQHQPVVQNTAQNENVVVDVHSQRQTGESEGSASLKMPAQSPFVSPLVEHRAKSPSTPKSFDAKGQPTLLEARPATPLASGLVAECKRNSVELTNTLFKNKKYSLIIRD